MGMFDSVKCAYELPHKEVQELEFQTKCLDSVMDEYFIDEEGSLFKVMHDREWEEDGTAPLGGYFKSVNSWFEKQSYHGYIDICTHSEEKDETGKNKWYEYRLKFTDDKLVEIEIIKD